MTTDENTRIAELEAQVAALTARLDAATPSGVEAGSEVEVIDEAEPQRGSRRNILKLAAGAAVGGTAAALATTSGKVAAVDGDPIEIGASTTQGNSGRTVTVLEYVNPAQPLAFGLTSLGNVFLVRDTGSAFPILANSSTYPASVAGYAYGVMDVGVYGRSGNPDGYGVVAQGVNNGLGSPPVTGLLARGTRANMQFEAESTAPRSRSDVHTVGEVIADNNGDLWFCVASGTPGTWKKLSGPATAGAFHAIGPYRVYDSRRPSGGGRYEGSANRTVSIKDGRDVATGEVDNADVVPAGATAIAANVAVIQPGTSGFLSVNPGGDAEVAASSVNYSAGENTSNAGIYPVNSDLEVQVIFGPGGGGHVAIDVTGYWT